MKEEAERFAQDLRDSTLVHKECAGLAARLMELIAAEDGKNRAAGSHDMMERRADVLRKEHPDYESIKDEYTRAGEEALKQFKTLLITLIGVFGGLKEAIDERDKRMARRN